MPTRPTQHPLEEQSRIAFRAALPACWQFRDKSPDYGIDGEVDIFDETGKATGDQFLVQLKATERSSKVIPSISLESEWIHYYLSLELPVLLVLWTKESQKLYWTWAGEIDLYYAKPNAKSLTTRLPNSWGTNTSQQIQQHLNLRRRLKSQVGTEPLNISVRAPDRPDLSLRVQSLCAHVPRILRFSSDTEDVNCTLVGDELTITFRGLNGAVFHAMRKIDDEGAAKRSSIGIIIALGNFGQLNQAAQLWSLVPGLDSAISSLGVAWKIASLLARAGASTELRAAIKSFIPRFGKANITLPLYSLYWHAPHHRRADLGSLLAELEQEDLRDATPEGKSIASYNVAKLDVHARPARAVGHFAAAISASEFYFDKAYFWKELGSLLFSHRRYQAALRCYRCAYEKLNYRERRSHYGDALMHTCLYADALEVFRSIIETAQSRAAEEGGVNREALSLDI